MAQVMVKPPPVAEKIWTAEDLLALADDENRYELVRGELIMMTPASPRHAKLASRLDAALRTHASAHNLGEVYTAEPGFELESDPEVIRAPDVAFVRRERIPPEGEPEGFWAIAPDLVVEVISPTETAQQVHEKVTDYLRAGTRLIWLVYPRTQTVVEYRSFHLYRVLVGGERLEGGDVVPGFSYAIQELFA